MSCIFNEHSPNRTWTHCVHYYSVQTCIFYYRTKLCRQQAEVQTMKMQIFAALDKMNPDTGNIRGINLVVVKNTTVQVTRLLL
jgi:hypothetical protein